MRTLYFYHELEEMYEDMLNDCYEPVSICGYNYDAGRALRLIDETAFRCGCSDWSSEDFEELHLSDMTPEEIEHYMLSDHQIMYCRHEDIEE